MAESTDITEQPPASSAAITDKKAESSFQPYVPDSVSPPEFTWSAVILVGTCSASSSAPRRCTWCSRSA